jgi:hypothetical protein
MPALLQQQGELIAGTQEIRAVKNHLVEKKSSHQA